MIAGPSGRVVYSVYVLDRSNTEIVCSNPTRGMDVCPRFLLFSCHV